MTSPDETLDEIAAFVFGVILGLIGLFVAIGYLLRRLLRKSVQ